MLTRRVSQLPARRVLSQTSVIPAGDREKEGERFYPLKREAGKFKCKFSLSPLTTVNLTLFSFR